MKMWRVISVSFPSAIVGAMIAIFAQSGRLSFQPTMSYADLAATLLAAVGVIVAIFGGVLAIAAFWGFEQMKRAAIDSATAVALQEVREQIENGALRTYMNERIAEEVNSPELERKILDRMARIANQRPEDALLDEDGDVR